VSSLTYFALFCSRLMALPLSLSLSHEASRAVNPYNFAQVETGFLAPRSEDGARACVAAYGDTVFSAFLLHQNDGGNATEPTITLQCFKRSSGCISLCDHDCRLSVTGNNKDGLSFPAPTCAWVATSNGLSNTVQCAGGCAGFLSSFTGSFKSTDFDNAMEMVFGEETSVGYLCGVKDAVTDPKRNVPIPGYCCLDTPTSSSPWGKSVSVWLRRFLIAELNSSRAHDCVIFSISFLAVHTSSRAQKTTARRVPVVSTRPILLG
jgi:hypothetical protein